MPLPFHVFCEAEAPSLFERSDGTFQRMEQGKLPPFIAGHRYLLVESSLAQFLQALQVERVSFEPAVIFDPSSGETCRSHTRVRIGQLFHVSEVRDLALDGCRLLTLNDRYPFVSPALKAKLEHGPFPYLQFSEGLSSFAGAT